MSLFRLLCLVLVFFLSLGFSSWSFSNLVSLHAQQRIHLGVLTWRDAPVLQQGWQATFHALEQALPGYHLEVSWLDAEELEQALSRGELDFILTNPGHYVHLSEAYLLAPLASLQNPEVNPPQQALGSAVITLAERDDLQTWSDLKGQSLGVVSLEAFGGFQLIQDEMEAAGFDWRRRLASIQTYGFPMEQLLDALVKQEVDAVVLRACLLESLAREGLAELKAFRVVKPQTSTYPCWHSSALYPDWPFLRTGRTAPEVARAATLALLDADSANQDSQWTAPLSYQPVYALFERLRVGPFAAFPHNPLAAAIQEYRYPLLISAAFLLVLLLHQLRVSHLLRKRTLELSAANAAAREKEQELTQLSRFALMGEMAAGLAHELNQPLTAILNYAQGSRNYLQREQEAVSELSRQRVEEALQKIIQQGQQSAEIIKNLRAFLRKEPASKELLDLSACLKEALAFMQASFRHKGIQLHLELEQKLPKVKANRAQLLQIFLNLLTNAADALAEVKQQPKEIRITAAVQDQKLVIQVADTGIGISDQVQAQLFRPFFTTKPQGMGLGLRLSQSFAADLGGSLQLTGRSAQGAVARLVLPLPANS